ncbi:hypothetical protein CANCADRAFT_146631 [Tortispora caseinolytica NRRL Y-17796]|uniref:Rhomboid-type serine protease n=1 Tax=Tortispora caseinolytica NRRL Y-17796 TaxID=767744 RepID=A0A1E4T9Y7_9ASCO|nr:hypothetical protein CANCADRAFT_146631 [Tortispora caseinolytica NRRL Y-17796]
MSYQSYQYPPKDESYDPFSSYQPQTPGYLAYNYSRPALSRDHDVSQSSMASDQSEYTYTRPICRPIELNAFESSYVNTNPAPDDVPLNDLSAKRFDGYPANAHMNHNPPPNWGDADTFSDLNKQTEPLKGSFLSKINWRTFPYVVTVASAAQIVVFIVEFVKMGILTGSPIQTQPTFNPMIGPSTYVLINMGARFAPCMHQVPGLSDQETLLYPCPNSTTVDTDVCSLSELCGFQPLGSPPDQWFRFITPIFLHAGIIHIVLNLVLQIRLGALLEREIGSIRFFIVYFACGIFGFLLGANYSPAGVASSGASGSLFGILAIDLLDLLFNWHLYERPVRLLILHIVEIIICFVLGLLPGLDNFAHIGGFIMGILLGALLMRSPFFIRRLCGNEDNRSKVPTIQFYWKHPKRALRGKSAAWYAWGAVRFSALAVAIVAFVLLFNNFYSGGGHCSWCKYFNCLPVNGWCDIGDLSSSLSSTSS